MTAIIPIASRIRCNTSSFHASSTCCSTGLSTCCNAVPVRCPNHAPNNEPPHPRSKETTKPAIPRRPGSLTNKVGLNNVSGMKPINARLASVNSNLLTDQSRFWAKRVTISTTSAARIGNNGQSNVRIATPGLLLLETQSFRYH